MSAILEVKNIHKSFEGTPIHQGISFNLNENECLGLLGRSGSGKSVLLRSLIGLERIDGGEIYYRGNRIDHLKEEDFFKIRTQISYSFQNGALFDSMNVYENPAYPLREHTEYNENEIKAKISNILQVVKLEDKEHLMPSELSGGMQKRIGLARSLILNPEIILYDEPTAGLDPKNIENIVNIMLELKKANSSSIFVTHDMPAAMEVCDRIVIIGEGKVQFNGTKEEMKQSDNPYIQDFFIMEGKA